VKEILALCRINTHYATSKRIYKKLSQIHIKVTNFDKGNISVHCQPRINEFKKSNSYNQRLLVFNEHANNNLACTLCSWSLCWYARSCVCL